MSWYLRFLSIILLLPLSLLAEKVPGPTLNIDVWPHPSSVTRAGTNQIFLDPNQFTIKCLSGNCTDLIENAIDRSMKYIFFAKINSPSKSIATNFLLTISINETNVPLALGIDESYSLEVSDTGGLLAANTEWGALRGLEIFSQLVNWNWTTGAYSIDRLPLSLTDEPRFSWRGLTLDTSRHYFTVKSILRQLDAMSFNHMNVLHWHIVDDESFPLQSSTYPLLSQLGAWSPRTIYSTSDVKKVIEYARERGIRVVPEFDMPGHCTSWMKGYPHLFAKCPNVHPNRPLLNPILESTYTFLKNFLTEMAKLFPDEFMHLGGDEVFYNCWKEDPSIQQFIQDNDLTYTDLGNYFARRVQEIGRSLGKTVILWEDPFRDNFQLSSNTVINVYGDIDRLWIPLLKTGRRGILSCGYYLDQQNPGGDSVYAWFDTWINFYKWEPIRDPKLTPAQIKLILGGEASMWTEQVDEPNLDGRIWPRTSATAERLWSPKERNDEKEALGRLVNHRCRMTRRGITPTPILQDHCYTVEDYESYINNNNY